jgi:hypothetical protein
MDSFQSLDRGSFHYQHPTFGSQSVNVRSGHQQSPPPRPSTRQGYANPLKEDITLTSTEIKYFDRPVPSGLASTSPGWRFHAAFGCLCLVNLVCALDATSLAVAIPVRTAHW